MFSTLLSQLMDLHNFTLFSAGRDWAEDYFPLFFTRPFGVSFPSLTLLVAFLYLCAAACAMSRSVVRPSPHGTATRVDLQL